MPGDMDGADLARSITRSSLSISVILISSYMDLDLYKRAVKEGLRQLSFGLERKQAPPYHMLISCGHGRGIRPSRRRARREALVSAFACSSQPPGFH